MSSTRAFFLLLLLCWASAVSGNRYIRRTGSSDGRGNFQNRIADLCNPESPSSSESAPQYTFNQNHVDSYALPIPQEIGQTSEARFLNQKPHASEIENPTTNDKGPVGSLFIHWTTGQPWMFTIPGEVLKEVEDDEWKGVLSEALWLDYEQKLDNAVQNELKDDLFRAISLLGNLDGEKPERSAFYAGFFSRFDKIMKAQVKKVLEKKQNGEAEMEKAYVKTVGLYNWKNSIRVPRECRVVCTAIETGKIPQRTQGTKCEVILGLGSMWTFTMNPRNTVWMLLPRQKKQVAISEFERVKLFSKLSIEGVQGGQ